LESTGEPNVFNIRNMWQCGEAQPDGHCGKMLSWERASLKPYLWDGSSPWKFESTGQPNTFYLKNMYNCPADVECGKKYLGFEDENVKLQDSPVPWKFSPPVGLESEFSTCKDPVVPPTGYTLCARFGKAKGSSLVVGGPDGSTYLSESWGNPTNTTLGNNCMNYADDAIQAFRIRTVDANCDIVVDTGDVAASSNIFKHALPTGDVKQEQVKLPSGDIVEGAGVISLNFANGLQGDWWTGKACSTAYANIEKHRSSICISDGTTYHNMIGGINEDGDKMGNWDLDGNGNGLWTCRPDHVCGDEPNLVFEVFIKVQ